MAEHKAVSVDPKDIERAQEMWGHFATATKIVTIATCVVLVGLALAFVKFS